MIQGEHLEEKWWESIVNTEKIFVHKNLDDALWRLSMALQRGYTLKEPMFFCDTWIFGRNCQCLPQYKVTSFFGDGVPGPTLGLVFFCKPESQFREESLHRNSFSTTPPAAKQKCRYCWWTKSCTTKGDDYPIIYRVLTIPGGAGFRPSTVFLGFLPGGKSSPQNKSSSGAVINEKTHGSSNRKSKSNKWAHVYMVYNSIYIYISVYCMV